jgi:hypothetical protein
MCPPLIQSATPRCALTFSLDIFDRNSYQIDQ